MSTRGRECPLALVHVIIVETHYLPESLPQEFKEPVFLFTGDKLDLEVALDHQPRGLLCSALAGKATRDEHAPHGKWHAIDPNQRNEQPD